MVVKLSLGPAKKSNTKVRTSILMITWVGLNPKPGMYPQTRSCSVNYALGGAAIALRTIPIRAFIPLPNMGSLPVRDTPKCWSSWMKMNTSAGMGALGFIH